MDKAVAGWLADTTEHKRKQFAKVMPRNSPQRDVHPFVPQPPTIGSSWTREDEDLLVEDGAKLRRHHKVDESKTAYRSLWLVSFLILKCTPWDIAGVASNFVYKFGLQGLPSQFRGALWSEDFCRQLAILIPHSAWFCTLEHGSIQKLRTALQYTIMLRTNDQRPWFPECAGDSFLEVFWSVSRAQKATGEPVSILTLHRTVLRECKRREVAVSTMSLLFRSLEAMIESPEPPRVATEYDLYSLTLDDVKTLRKALDNTTNPATRMIMWPPAQVIASCTVHPHIKRDSITFEQLSHWHDLAQIQEFRLLRQSPGDDSDSVSLENDQDLESRSVFW